MLINNDINLTFQKMLMAKYMTRQLYVILSHAGNTPGYVHTFDDVIVILSVRLSVRLSVTLVHCVHMV